MSHENSLLLTLAFAASLAYVSRLAKTVLSHNELCYHIVNPFISWNAIHTYN